jgi:hypothetical protein
MAVRAKLQQYMTTIFKSVTIDSDGDFSAREGSARLFAGARSVGDDGHVVINIFTPLLIDVQESPELYRYIAYHSDDYIFGHLSMSRGNDGKLRIFISHRLLGDYLDEAELGYAFVWMLNTADELDDKLQAQFGGSRFHEE